MFPLPTIRVVNPTAPSGFMLINERDRTADHELWTPEMVDRQSVDDGLSVNRRVGKGARGKWYGWVGAERKVGPFDTDVEAAAALKGV